MTIFIFITQFLILPVYCENMPIQQVVFMQIVVRYGFSFSFSGIVLPFNYSILKRVYETAFLCYDFIS